MMLDGVTLEGGRWLEAIVMAEFAVAVGSVGVALA
jgi:hypothetical protein